MTIGEVRSRWDIARIVRALKGRWMEFTFPHGPDYRDEVAGFDRLYLVRDPWSLDKLDSEQFRFRRTNQLILSNFGHSYSLLEIGCGEGIQSRYLQQVCEQLYGMDVSFRAIRRARRRCPYGTFGVGNMYAIPPAMPTRYDVVTACEVLYYMMDVPRALRRISELGRTCVVSYYQGARTVLDQHVEPIQGVQLETVHCGDASWRMAWWQP